MRIPELFGTGKPLFSFEFFPPKTEKGARSLLDTIERLRELEPSFVSVTYGAGGSTRDSSVDLVTRIKHDYGIEAMAHLTCVGHDHNEIAALLDRLEANGIENIMALRGDPPQGQGPFVRHPNGFAYAAELVHFIRARGYAFALGGAGYPEGHVECRDLDLDLEHLRQKVAAGLDFVVTQLFFDNVFYFQFVDRARRAGITVPIVPGIMPITDIGQIERFTRMCGATIPPALHDRLQAVGQEPEAVRNLGVDYATAQCRDLIVHGAPGIHFFTLNQSAASATILARIRR
jgi:methylenetetrahydrofolate reductase (NADPH)